LFSVFLCPFQNHYLGAEEFRKRGLTLEKKWTELTPDEKRQERFKPWLSPEVKFANAPAEKAYKERVTRLINAITLKEPDRVPVILPAGFFPAYYAGKNLQTVMYNYDELRQAWLKFLHDFDADTFTPPVGLIPGKVFERLGFKLYKWPGYGLGSDVPSYQFVEGEYMKPDEYDSLLKDPSDFWMRTHVPRIFGALEPFKKLSSFTTIVELPFGFFMPFTQPDIREALKSIIDAGEEMEKWVKAVGDCSREGVRAGFPSMRGTTAKAPFDTIGDTLRGMQGIIMDMYRQPQKLLDAMERITVLTIESAVAAVNASGGFTVMMPLHKGDDSFMSDKQYQTFYWPTLKKVVLGLINEGIVPLLFAEGSYNKRLEVIKDLPKGAVIWQFDQTDMAKAKKALGANACIAGNVPTSLLVTGTPVAVKEYCRKLIENCGKGGFILTGGANLDTGRADNLHAMVDAVMEYGV
jgi:hypothetical protein